MSKEKENVFGDLDFFNLTTHKSKIEDPTKEAEVESVATKESLNKEAIENEPLKTTEVKTKDTKKTSEISDSKGSDESKSKTNISTDDSADEEADTDLEATSGDEEESTEEVADSEEFTYKPVVKHLFDKGILDVEETDLESIDGSDESFEKVIDKTVSSRVSKVINDYKDSLPEDYQKFMEYVEMGGDPKQFLDIYYGEGSLDRVDIESEANQKAVITQSLKLAGWEDAEIEDELADYENLGKLDIKAKSHLSKLKQYDEKRKASMLEQQKATAKQQEQSVKQYWDGLKKELFAKEAIKGFKLTPKMKDEIWEYMAVPDRKSGMTKLQEFNNKDDNDSKFLYAYLAMNNLDITKLKTAVKTEVTSDLKNKLGRFTDTRQKMASGKTAIREDVQSEMENAFDGFSKLKLTSK